MGSRSAWAMEPFPKQKSKPQGKNKTPKGEESRREGQGTDNGTPNHCVHAVSSMYFNNGVLDRKLNHYYH